MALGIILVLSGVTIGVTVISVGFCLMRMKSEFAHANISGKQARVADWHGFKGHVVIHGKRWAAYSGETLHLHPGDKVIVSKIDNEALKIQPMEEDLEAVDLV